MKEQPTAAQVQRWEEDHSLSYNKPCIRCGDKVYGTCPCPAWKVRELAWTIYNLGAVRRKKILEGTQVKTLEQQAAELVEKANEMLKAAEKLQAKAAATKYVYPVNPNWKYASIDIRFRGNPGWYSYVLLFQGNGIYTTGRDEKTSFFQSWTDFVDFLRSDEVTNVSRMYRLSTSGSGEAVTVVPNE